MKSSPRPPASVKPAELPAPAPADPPPGPAFPDPIPGVIPFGTLTIFAGAAGVGKTVMLSEMLARMRDGRPVWGHPTNPPTGFFYLAADRPWYPTFADTFACAGFPDIAHYALADDPDQRPSQWQERTAFLLLESILTDKLKPTPGSVLVIDPAYPLFIKGDQNKARDVAVSLHVYRKLITRFQVSVICCSNVTKERTDSSFVRPQDRISGSGAFSAYSDTQMYLMDKKGEGYPQLFGWTPRRAAAEEFQVEFDQKTRLFVPYTGQLPADDPEIAPLADVKLQPVLDLIPPFPDAIRAADLEDLALGTLRLSRATLHRYLTVLEGHGLIARPRGYVKRCLTS